ncbi:MAG: peroxiredoxin [Deltaproteobacteria bacterium HGW-Deltaproteobacteria-12]|nr:MAG: peroxiredoxin [Deltaproteobacteria bacterium HGW-Deltaproteobacteria-12]
MAAQKVLKVGTKVRDFSLKDQNSQIFQLSGCKDKKVLLSFHPLAWTPVCAQQMKSLEKNNKVFQKLNTVAVGISVDSVPSKSAWAKSLKISQTRLLADFWPHGGVAKAYGIFREEGFSERANIIVDRNGRIALAKTYPIGQLPDIDKIIEHLKLL